MDKKTIKVDKNYCIGCGSCSAISPGCFRLNDDFKAEVLDEVTDDEETIQMAKDSCPTEAISIN